MKRLLVVFFLLVSACSGAPSVLNPQLAEQWRDAQPTQAELDDQELWRTLAKACVPVIEAGNPCPLPPPVITFQHTAEQVSRQEGFRGGLETTAAIAEKLLPFLLTGGVIGLGASQ